MVRDYFWMQMKQWGQFYIARQSFYFYSSNPLNQPVNVPAWPGKSLLSALYQCRRPSQTRPIVFPRPHSYHWEAIRRLQCRHNSALTQFPQTILNTTNRLQVFMLDGNHVIDYVSFSAGQQPQCEFGISKYDSSFSSNRAYYTNGVWSTALNSDGTPLALRRKSGYQTAVILR